MFAHCGGCCPNAHRPHHSPPPLPRGPCARLRPGEVGGFVWRSGPARTRPVAEAGLGARRGGRWARRCRLAAGLPVPSGGGGGPNGALHRRPRHRPERPRLRPTMAPRRIRRPRHRQRRSVGHHHGRHLGGRRPHRRRRTRNGRLELQPHRPPRQPLGKRPRNRRQRRGRRRQRLRRRLQRLEHHGRHRQRRRRWPRHFRERHDRRHRRQRPRRGGGELGRRNHANRHRKRADGIERHRRVRICTGDAGTLQRNRGRERCLRRRDERIVGRGPSEPGELPRLVRLLRRPRRSGHPQLRRHHELCPERGRGRRYAHRLLLGLHDLCYRDRRQRRADLQRIRPDHHRPRRTGRQRVLAVWQRELQLHQRNIVRKPVRGGGSCVGVQRAVSGAGRACPCEPGGCGVARALVHPRRGGPGERTFGRDRDRWAIERFNLAAVSAGQLRPDRVRAGYV